VIYKYKYILYQMFMRKSSFLEVTETNGLSSWVERRIYSLVCMAHTRSWPREGQLLFLLWFVFFKVLKRASPYVATKVTKKASAEMLLCAHCLYPAMRTEPRAAIICPALLTQFHFFCKTCYAPAIAQGHHRSARFRPKLICWRGRRFF